jgi:hypothetical protein
MAFKQSVEEMEAQEAKDLVLDLVEALRQLMGAVGTDGGPTQLAFAKSRAGKVMSDAFSAIVKWDDREAAARGDDLPSWMERREEDL